MSGCGTPAKLDVVRVALEISAGELIDRITILELKRARLASDELRADVQRQLSAALEERERTLPQSAELQLLTEELGAVNRELWQTEDELRECERRARFGPRFVKLARNVYKANDRRTALKRLIDELVGSDVREHKLYAGECQK